jgi:hypothetical protein
MPRGNDDVPKHGSRRMLSTMPILVITALLGLPIVEEGKPRAALAPLSATASPEVRRAADELQRVLQKMTGTKPPWARSSRGGPASAWASWPIARSPPSTRGSLPARQALPASRKQASGPMEGRGRPVAHRGSSARGPAPRRRNARLDAAVRAWGSPCQGRTTRLLRQRVQPTSRGCPPSRRR